MIKKIIVATAAMVAMSAFAVDMTQVEKAIPLKNGSTVYIFKDGKMSMENKTGRVERMKEGEVMDTKDGGKIMMHGDEVMRLEQILHADHKG
ncbi:MAG TPA: periplasmic Cu(I)/Cu(II)-binding protein CopK [Rhodocyclaceae bacterium]|jgi:biopolymer transport protein ExbD